MPKKNYLMQNKKLLSNDQFKYVNFINKNKINKSYIFNKGVSVIIYIIYGEKY